jgi:pyridoxine 4-dehydrogenase
MSTFTLGGVREVHRIGFGAMRITGPGVWGEPANRDECIRVLRRAVELGVDFIDTADSYGPYVSEEIIREALRPYPANLTIATKAGLVRPGPGQWEPVGRPAYLRQECEMSLRRLGLERIHLYQLHRIDPEVPLEDQLGTFVDLQREGKIDLIGVSNFTVEDVERGRAIARIVSVQNMYNLARRQSEPVLELCAREGLGFIPWFPIDTGNLARPGSPLEQIAQQLGVTPAQLALAWLLRRSPVMLPIPGTASVQHLEENCAAAGTTLSDEQFEQLSALG